MNKIFTAIILIAGLLFLYSCSPSKKFTNEEDENEINVVYPTFKNEIRVLLAEKLNSKKLKFSTPVVLIAGTHKLNLGKGNLINIQNENDILNIKSDEISFRCKVAEIISIDQNNLFIFDNKNYRGMLKLFCDKGRIKFINVLNLDDYLRGVIPSEMPLGNGIDYNEALKAFAICARTYALSRINKDNDFDIYSDVRDQVYAGATRENDLINKITTVRFRIN